MLLIRQELLLQHFELSQHLGELSRVCHGCHGRSRHARTRLLRDTSHGLNVRTLSGPIVRDRAVHLRSLLTHHLSLLRDLTLQTSNHPLSGLLLKLLSVLWRLNRHTVPWWRVLSLGGESNTVLELLLVLGHLLEIRAMD